MRAWHHTYGLPTLITNCSNNYGPYQFPEKLIPLVTLLALDGKPLFQDQSARERALDVFSHLRIWDTAHNNGVLIYLLLADRDVEIVADRGIDARVGAAGWQKICAAMETDFRGGNFAGGVIKGIQAVSQQLAMYYPKQGAGPNELPDTPVVM